MNKSHLAFLAVLLVAALPHALRAEGTSSKWQSFDEDTGLPGKRAKDLLLDDDGNLWVAFDRGGVSRFDGEKWTTYTREVGLAGDRATVLFQDREGTYWFGTDGGGVSRFDGSRWTSLTTADGLAANKVVSIVEDRGGDLWFGTESEGVSRFDGENWTTYDVESGLANDEIEDAVRDSTGNLWFATGGGVSRFDGQTWTTFTSMDGPGHDRVTSILQDREGNLWFGTEGAGAARFDGREWKVFDVQDGLVQNDVEDIFQDRNGDLWFATNGGVSRFDGRRWVSYTTQDGLTHGRVRSIAQDWQGQMWLATEDGLSRFDPDRSSSGTTNFLAGRKVKSISQDDEGNLWFGTDGHGATRYDGRTWITFTTEDGLGSNKIEHVFCDPVGNVWFGTEGGGISRFDGANWTTITTADGIAHDQVECILQDRAGQMWVGTDGGGVSRFDGKSWTTFDTDSGLAHNEAKEVIEDTAGAIWVATEEGVSRFDGSDWITFGTADGLAHHKVETIVEDSNGSLWIGTDGGGVSRYHYGEWTTFARQDGLGGNVVMSIIEDDKGHMWFGTEGGGVSQFDGRHWTTFTSAQGLAHDVVRSVLQDRDGRLWFGTEDGVSSYVPPVSTSLEVRIEAIVADRRYEDLVGLSIPSSSRLVAFEFGASDLSGAPGSLLFEYRLKGFDQEWKSTRHRRVEYQNLPRGSYTFQIAAIDRNLIRSESLATTPVLIRWPRFYLIIASAMGLALLLIIVQTIRVFKSERKLRKLNAELQGSHEKLEHRVEERTTDLQSAYEKLQLEMSDRKRAEGALAESEGRYRKLVELSPDIISIHRDDQIAYINEEGAKLLGARGPDEFIGRSSWDVMHPDYVKRISRYVRHLDLFTSPPMTELKLKRVDGSDLDVEIAAVPFTYLDGPAILVISRDITARKNAEEARQIAEEELESQRVLSVKTDRLRSLGEMAAGIAHELNQPLVSVRGLAEHTLIGMERGWDSSPGILSGRLSRIIEQADRMVHIIDHVRRFAREAGKPEVSSLSINDVVNSSLELLGAQFRSHSIALETKLGEGLPSVTANPFSLEEVLLNLLNNARDAVSELSASGQNNAEILIRTTSLGNQVQVDVGDNGGGIPAEIVAKVFDPFLTTKDPDKGTGLGLSISRSIVEEFGGSMEIQSSDEGTNVSFTLPAG